MKSILVLLVSVAVAFAAQSYNSPHFIDFVQWMKKTGHKYHSVDWETRYAYYMQSVDRIKESTATHKTDVDWFSAYTPEEYTKYGCGLEKLSDSEVPSGFVQPLTSFPEGKTAPKSWDWTHHGFNTPVKNQADCSACGAFSAVGAMEGVLAAKHNQFVSLSEQQMIDCNPSSQGCTGTYPALVFENTLNAEPMKGGVDAEADYQCDSCFVWKQEKREVCKYKPDAKAATLKGFSQFCHAGSDACDEDSLANYLFNHGPVSVCLDMSDLRDYKSGIVQPSTCSVSNINHCVTLVGYGEEEEQKYWKIKNSFGAAWGENGYARIARGKSACGINQIVSAPTF